MALMGKARPLLVLVQLVLGRVQLAWGAEQSAGSVSVSASKYDTRSSLPVDDNKGCFTDGCGPELMLDGLENDIPESRWSCEEALPGTITECYATFDLGSSFTLTKLSMWFHESFDTTRETRAFAVSTSDDGSAFADSFEAENTAGLSVGVADDFPFPAGSSGQFVRVTGLLLPDQWLSISEVEVFVDVNATAAPAATPVDTTAPMVTTPSPTVVSGEACANVTVSNAGELSGVYSSADGTSDYVSTGTNAATLAASQTPAVCADPSTADCTVQRWQIRPQDDASTLPSYVVYDEAAHPSDIVQVWLRLDGCDTSGCTSSPTDVNILCGDGSKAGSATPAPVSPTSSDCGIIEVAGTSGAVGDGFYYDDGSSPANGVTQYQGYDDANGELTSNGNAVVSKRVDTTCTSTSTVTSANADACSWRQWWIEPASTDALDYYTFDEANHPVDIAPGALWYTSNLTVVPYDGDVTITCAPATTPTLEVPITPAPTRGEYADDDLTRAPVPASSNRSTESVADSAEESEGDSNTVAIAGGVVGGVALLAIVGAVAYKLKKAPPPPPSYDDLVGG